MAGESKQGLAVDASGGPVIDPHQSGIYEIRNTVNGKRYIGSAVKLRRRQTEHYSALSKGTHCNRKLQSAWDKYGEPSFAFQVLLICAKSDLLIFEQRCLDSLRPSYNLSPTAGSQLGYKFSPEAMVKMAARPVRRWTDEEKAKVSDSLRGRQKSPEHLARISAALIGKPSPIRGTRLSEETKAKISQANRGRKRTPEQRANNAAARRGKRLSDEHKVKLSIAGKRYHAERRALNG